MRLVFKKSLKEELTELIQKAYKEERKIERIILTKKEYESLKEELNIFCPSNTHYISFMGHEVNVE